MPDRMYKIHQTDIAKALGMSQATVSLALRGDERVSEETRARVSLKAKEMGYGEPVLEPNLLTDSTSVDNTHKSGTTNVDRRKIGQAQIARVLGLSQSTVSAALRGKEIVNKETREAVVAMAEELGYVPDPNLVALSNRRSTRRKRKFLGTLAWVSNHDTPDGWKKGETARRQYEGVAAQAADLGYKLEELWLGDPEKSEAEFSEILLARGIRGLFLAPQPRFGVNLTLDLSQFSVVTFGSTLAYPRFHRVANNLLSATRLAYHKLDELGYERVGLVVNKDVDHRTNYCLSAAYMSMSEELSGRALIPLLTYQELDESSFFRWFKQNRPDALLAMSEAGIKIMQWLESAGIEIGKDFGIASLNWHQSRSSLAGIDQLTEHLGKAAVNVMHRMLRNTEYGIPHYRSRTLISGTWRDGESAKKRSGITREKV